VITHSADLDESEDCSARCRWCDRPIGKVRALWRDEYGSIFCPDYRSPSTMHRPPYPEPLGRASTEKDDERGDVDAE
jgi:hypothetical protein